MIYSEKSTQSLQDHRFAFLKVKTLGARLKITLNRSEKKNAIHPVMLNELAFALYHAKFNAEIWIIELGAEGDVFCSGADLKAMMGDLGEFDSTIPNPEAEILLGTLFQSIHKPIIGIVKGDVYAGGLLLLTGCHYVLASQEIKLGLPETKRGLFPYQVMAKLLEIMPQKQVLDWCMRGYTMDALMAKDAGILSHVFEKTAIDQELEQLVAELLLNSPSAIQLGLEAFEKIKSQENHHSYLQEMFIKTLQTQDAMEGMMAFRQKRKPQWKGK